MSELPEGWESTNIDYLGEYINGATFKPQDWSKEGKPIIRIQNLTNPNRPFNYSDRELDSKYHVSEGDILVSWSATLDAFIWQKEDAWLNQHIFKVVPNPEIDKKFLFYSLKEAILELKNSEHLHGSTMKHINRKPFLAHEMPVPPLSEQRRIRRKLDHILEAVNSAKVRLDKVPTILKYFRQSVLSSYLSPRDTWTSDKLGNLLESLRYGTSKKCSYDNNGTPILRIPNVSEGGIDSDDMKYTKLNDQEYSKLSLREGDILVIRSNGSINLVGKTALISKEEAGWGFAGYLIRLRFDPNRIHPEFLNYYLSSTKIRDYIELTGRSTSGVNNINSKEVSNIEVVFPNIDEQREIAERIRELMDFSRQVEEKYNQAMESVTKITQSVLAKAFRGELVPQDPNDEPASILLQRIKSEKVKSKQKIRNPSRKTKDVIKMISSVLDTLKKEKTPLSAQNLLQKSGYPADSDPEQIEEFFLDIKKALSEGTIVRERVNDEDYFRLAA